VFAQYFLGGIMVAAGVSSQLSFTLTTTVNLALHEQNKPPMSVKRKGDFMAGLEA
jgi:hypothetical protein